MRNILFILLLIFSVATLNVANAQNLRITHVWSHTNLSFDLNKLYNYNKYEKHRFGAGFFINTPLKYDNRYGTLFQNSFYADIYSAWGMGDNAWKYGGSIALRFPRYILRKVYLGYLHDIEKAGNHHFEPYNIFNTTGNSTYISSHYSAVDRIWGGVDVDVLGPGFITAELRHSAERLLFDAYSRLYPLAYENEALPRKNFNELHLRLKWGKDWMVDILAGESHPFGERLDSGTDLQEFASIVAQYSHTFTVGKKNDKLSIFGQTGTTVNSRTPISRRFDMSGTGGSHFFFRNTFLTVTPNSLTADQYLQLCFNYTFETPLWRARISKPKVFLQLNSMWGMLATDDGPKAQNTYTLLDCYPVDETTMNLPVTDLITLTAPSKGLLEPSIGIDYLLHWGIFDFGAAVAYQLAPQNSLYYKDNFLDKFAVMLVAKLIFETLDFNF